MHKLRVVLLVMVLAVVGAGAGTGQAGPRDVVASLAGNGTAFWDEEAGTTDDIQAPCRAVCLDYAVLTRTEGERLRIAVDASKMSGAELLVYAADGKQQLARATGVYSTEVYVASPDAGRYLVRVVPRAGVVVRMRAKLERGEPASRSTRALLPNLRLVPPYEFTLQTPIAGVDPGCNEYERAEYGAQRCLRFSLGPMNVGEGPFMLTFPPASGFLASEPVYQRILHADGRKTLRQAGSALFHKTHAHHHHNGFGSLELLRVTNAQRGTMVAAGGGPKQGFCMLDYLIADWRAFANASKGSVRQDCSVETHTQSTELGLGRGWGDIYSYSLDGNYVDFAGMTDGRYVVRSVADASNDVLETDETDNAGYAYIDVRGSRVEVLERGQGRGPWDPRKVLAKDILPPNA